MILVDRTLADSQELLIAISKSYSFPGMHYVTSEEGKGADGQILISRVIIYFPSSPPPTPPFSLSNMTPALQHMIQRCSNVDIVWRDNYGFTLLTTVGLPYVLN